jgi:hypothetical protein
MALKKVVKKISEHDEQVLVFEWAKLSTGKYPFLGYMFGTLNGVKLSIGQAVKAKRSGNTKGVPDIILPYPNGKYYGLYIELKVGKNKPSKEQKEYIEYLNSVGYFADVRYGSTEAIDLIKDYIQGLI